MIEGNTIRRSQGFLRLSLGDHLIQTFEDGETATVQTAVALLRTVFEDHYVDPEHRCCLFFHGCMLSGRQKAHDFSVIHRGDRVVLSDFTFEQHGPAYVSLPIGAYALEVVRFASQVLQAGKSQRRWSEWQQGLVNTQWSYLAALTRLGRQFVEGGGHDYPKFCLEFHALHGRLKRPLELLVLEILEHGAPRHPVRIQSRVLFGPLGVRQAIPMCLNRGDVILVTVNQFTNTGAVLTLEGVGSGGVRPGDRLFGLQVFYP